MQAQVHETRGALKDQPRPQSSLPPLQVKIDLSVPSSSQASASRRGAASAASSSPGSDVPPGFAPRSAAAHAGPPSAALAPVLASGQQARGLPVPISLAPGGAPGALPVPPHAVAGLAVLPPAPCAYCQGPHSMKNCRDFHHVLQSIYQVRLSCPPAWQCRGCCPFSDRACLFHLQTVLPRSSFLPLVSFRRQAGYQHGFAAAQQAQQPPAPPALS